MEFSEELLPNDLNLQEEVKLSNRQERDSNLVISEAKENSLLVTNQKILRREEIAASKILILGDQYAINFSAVLEKFITRQIYTIAEIIKPKMELSLLTSSIFEKSLSYGQEKKKK
ncbi:hypothetical protein JTB14_010581 [Gonioctena quinquepunctata]|nr:hypothetical protein JTB14_010581 [Gonioctena quinquepunctata]